MPPPRRFQLRRTRGYRKPDGTVARSVERHRGWLADVAVPGGLDIGVLRGRDLACWCPLDGPCHADNLLDLANRPCDGSTS